MKKLYANLWAAAAMVAVSAFTSTAMADDTADYPVIEMGSTITLDVKTQDAIWQFTAPETGLLQVDSDSWSRYAGLASGTFLYTQVNDGVVGGPVLLAVPYTYGEKGLHYTFEVNEGTTYYVFFGTTMLAGEKVNFTFEISHEKLEPEIANIFPAPDAKTPYPFAFNPDIQLIFNVIGNTVIDGDTYLNYVDASGNAVKVYIEPTRSEDPDFNRWDIDVYAAIMKAKNDPAGIMKNSPFSIDIAPVTINGVQVTGPDVEANGHIELNYLYGNLVTCISREYPNPMMSYWPEGDSDAIVKFVFDDELMPISNSKQAQMINMFAGPYDPLRYGEEGWPQLTGAPLVIEGNTVTVDLSGVRRPDESHASALTVLKEDPVVTLQITGLLDADGYPVDYFRNSFVQLNDVPFVLLEKIDLTYELTPGTGDLANVDEIEFWTLNETFDHVRIESFTFTAGETTVVVDDLKIVADDASSSIINIPVPAAIKAVNGQVVLKADFVSLDGYDYELSANYTNTVDESGVEAVEAENVLTVYGIDGVSLGTTNDINALPKGFYIVNGRKVLVK